MISNGNEKPLHYDTSTDPPQPNEIHHYSTSTNNNSSMPNLAQIKASQLKPQKPTLNTCSCPAKRYKNKNTIKQEKGKPFFFISKVRNIIFINKKNKKPNQVHYERKENY